MSFLDVTFVYFILLFFPIYFVLSSINTEKANIFIGLSSFLFVAWYYPPFSLIILFQLIIIHSLYKGKIKLPLSIFLVLLPLFVFKYSAFFASIFGFYIVQLPLPLGISFYTFTAIAVLFEISRNHEINNSYSVQNSLKILAFWPHLASGPVLRPENVWRQPIPFRQRDLTLAFILIIFGLFKKVVIGDGAGAIVSRAMELGIANLSAVDIFNMSLAMSIQIYGDFSGYSDMALGFALLVGVQLPANFNYPYLADSMTDFWRRWHISLTSWFRDYFYFSLGGNRKNIRRTYVNIFIVFLVSGLWHGAAFNFIIWGALHGALLIMEKLTRFNRLPGIIKRMVVLPVIILSWMVFFLSPDDLVAVFDSEIFYRANNPNAFGISVILFLVLIIIEHLFKPYTVNNDGFPEKTLSGMALAPAALVICTIFWSDPLPFIYFDF